MESADQPILRLGDENKKPPFSKDNKAKKSIFLEFWFKLLKVTHISCNDDDSKIVFLKIEKFWFFLKWFPCSSKGTYE